MHNPNDNVNDFKILVEKHFSFLRDYEFHRESSCEETSPSGCSTVFKGENVGLIISLDIRDLHVDVQVVRVDKGALKRNFEGGYSADLYIHLVRNAGYRGKTSKSTSYDKPSTDKELIDKMISSWANLLITAGAKILEDKQDSLPR